MPHTPTVSDWRARRKPWTPREWTPRLDFARKRADGLVSPGVFVVARVHKGAEDGPVVYVATKGPTTLKPAPEIEIADDGTYRKIDL